MALVLVATLAISACAEDFSAALGGAEESLQDGQYAEVVRRLRRHEVLSADQSYERHRLLATAHAGLGEASRSVEHTLHCLELDRRRAIADLPAIARPYLDNAVLDRSGVDFYTAMQVEIPHIWWLPANLAALARKAGDLGLAQQAEATANALRGRSIILIVVDTLRADHLGAYGYQRPTSPHFDSWAKEGRLYERALASSSWTLPSMGSLYTGYIPMRHRAGRPRPGFNQWEQLSPSVPTLAELLAKAGYSTGAVVNNPYLSPEFGVDRGFAIYDLEKPSNQTVRRASKVVDDALAMIDQWTSPFFLLVHFFDPHMDYDPPGAFRGRFTARHRSTISLPVTDMPGIRRQAPALTVPDRDFIRAAYDEEIAYLDSELKRFTDGLSARGLLNQALVILTSDHGEELFDHDGFEHGHAMWQEILHVPLVIWGPEVLPGREPQPVSLVDIPATVLEFAGETGAADLDGRSLWPNLLAGTAIAERTLYAEGNLYGQQRSTVVRWPLKVVASELEPFRAADLDQDPAERSDLLLTRAQVGDELMRELRTRALKEADLRAQSEDRVAQPGAETLEKLRALGYVQ